MSIVSRPGPVNGPPFDIPHDFATGPQIATALAIPRDNFAEMEQSGDSVPMPVAFIGVKIYYRPELDAWNADGRPPLHRWHARGPVRPNRHPEDVRSIRRLFLAKVGVA